MQIRSATINRHSYGIYPSIAMLAGMQLDVFTPLKNGPMTADTLASVLGVRTEKLRPLLYALVHAELLNLVGGDHFANTPEADVYLVRGRPTYLGSSHELYSDLWTAALKAGQSIRAGKPQAKHDFMAMSDEELGSFFRGLNAGTLATGRQLTAAYDFTRFHHLLDVGGGSAGVSIAACAVCPNLKATVVELPRGAPIAQAMVRESNLADRVQILMSDIEKRAPKGRFDVCVLRSLIQVMGPEAACRSLKNVGEVIERGGWLFIVGHVLEDGHLGPPAAVCMNLAFLSVYEEGQAYTEREHRIWLAEAGFGDINVHYGVAPGGASIITARKGA
jgi:hypothetical protein